jgi:hypothetical protein
MPSIMTIAKGNRTFGFLHLPWDTWQLHAWHWPRRQNTYNAHPLSIIELTHFQRTSTVNCNQLLHNCIVRLRASNFYRR